MTVSWEKRIDRLHRQQLPESEVDDWRSYGAEALDVLAKIASEDAYSDLQRRNVAYLLVRLRGPNGFERTDRLLRSMASSDRRAVRDAAAHSLVVLWRLALHERTATPDQLLIATLQEATARGVEQATSEDVRHFLDGLQIRT